MIAGPIHLMDQSTEKWREKDVLIKGKTLSKKNPKKRFFFSKNHPYCFWWPKNYIKYLYVLFNLIKSTIYSDINDWI